MHIISKFLLDLAYIEDITRLREDMDFMFEWQEQYRDIVLATRT